MAAGAEADGPEDAAGGGHHQSARLQRAGDQAGAGSNQGHRQVIPDSHWSRDLILQSDWSRHAIILSSEWLRDVILTPDWLQGLAGVQWPGAEPPGGAGGGHQGGPGAGGPDLS